MVHIYKRKGHMEPQTAYNTATLFQDWLLDLEANGKREVDKIIITKSEGGENNLVVSGAIVLTKSLNAES